VDDSTEQLPVEVVFLLASSIHRYEGRPSEGPLPAREVESRQSIEVRAGLGIVGDRYFGAKAHVREAVTVFAIEALEAVSSALQLKTVPDVAATRRNIVLRGVDIDAMRGRSFTLDSGDGPVEFIAHRPANPCSWMDVTLAPGAFRAMRGLGGMRCEPLTSGVLRLGPAVLTLTREAPVPKTQ
jgi:MOSC domain-containing protein YiiM